MNNEHDNDQSTQEMPAANLQGHYIYLHGCNSITGIKVDWPIVQRLQKQGVAPMTVVYDKIPHTITVE